ncbi:MAG: TetR/AcrR family transcriptional regulator [Anaerolineaceae bacterium]
MDNQLKLLDCALELFSARGYDAVGIQEIVDAAGVTKPTLYHYFNSKRGLLDALLAGNFTALIELTGKTTDYHHDLVLTLEKTARAYFDYAREHPAFYRLHLTMYFAPPDSEPHQAVMDYQRCLYQMLEDLFAEAVTDHGNMRGRQKLYAATFMGMINTYIGLFLSTGIELNDQLVYQAVHQFMHGIFS